MNICILTHTMPRFKKDTNSASFISELAISLSNAGHKVVVLTPYDPLFENYKRPFKVVTYKYVWPEFLHQSGYSRVLQGDKKMKPSMYVTSTLMSLSALIHLIKVVRKEKIDVISAHWAIPNGFIAFLVSKLTNTPYTITIPGSDVYLAGKNIFFKLTTKIATLGANWVVSDSQHYLNQLKELGIKPKNQDVIRYGVDTKILKPAAKSKTLLSKWGIIKNQKVVLALGRFVEKKGFINLIQALPQVLKVERRVKLVLVGDGELRKEFEQKVKKLKIDNDVVFAGSVPYSDRALYYTQADIFVMPSVKDSGGNIDASPVAMMDAMSCGIPVIATKYSGSPDLIMDGKTGWMVKENNSTEIAKAIIKLLKIKSYTDLKKATRKIAVENFSLESTAKKYTDIFKTITT